MMMKQLLACAFFVSAALAQIQHPDVYVHGQTTPPGWGTEPRWDGDAVHFPSVNKTLLFGGNRFEAGGFVRSTNDYHVRDGATGAWTDTLSGSPINQRSAFKMPLCPLDGNAYLMGGAWLTGSGVNVLQSVYRVSMSAAGVVTFTQMVNCPVPIANYGVVWYPEAGSFIIVGGDAAGNITADVRVFNPDLGGTWGHLPNAIVDGNGAPFPIRLVSLMLAGSEIYITGGLDSAGAVVQGVWKFNPIALKFQPIAMTASGVFGDVAAGPFALFGAKGPGACLPGDFASRKVHQLTLPLGFQGLNLVGGPDVPGHRFQPFGCQIDTHRFLIVGGRMIGEPIKCAAGQWDVANDAWILVAP